MLSASSPLMSMSDLQTAQASSFQSWPKSLGWASALRSRMYFSDDGQHAARAAGRVVDGFDDVAAGEVFLRREQEIDHELDDLARREVFPGLLVRLLRADPDEFLEDVAHLDVVHAGGRKVDGGKTLDDKIEQVLFGHLGDLRRRTRTAP